MVSLGPLLFVILPLACSDGLLCKSCTHNFPKNMFTEFYFCMWSCVDPMTSVQAKTHKEVSFLVSHTMQLT